MHPSTWCGANKLIVSPSQRRTSISMSAAFQFRDQTEFGAWPTAMTAPMPSTRAS